MAFTFEIAQKHLDAWLDAEIAVTNGQSYTIGSKSLDRANLYQIREQVKYWSNELSKAKNILKNKGRNRVMRVVPRDL
ncbi:hypothetical protein psyc5s11_45040 [Clostridium gelidum]|uniref:Phage protein n=1 Tax=Clostridium gelidum TaxID=704125 RepID=A0ABN6J6B4_9CLOT|nr:DUF6148 family protein [Clostridium gelidum]BCZ48437.1 hypothetical protein psyc5s11_45040 [Clostridium gelidum]